MKKIIIVPVLVIIATAGLYAWKEYTRGHVTTSSIQPKDNKSAAELVTAFEADESKANKLYNDKAIVVKGRVQKITIENDIINISLSGTSPMSGVICQFEKNEQEKIKQVKTGDEVAIKGICTGYLMDVILVRCVINN